MTSEQWLECFQRLRKGHPSIPFSGDMARAWFEELKDLRAEHVLEGVRGCLREIPHWPKVAEVRSRALAAARAAGPPVRVYCDTCGGTGWAPVEPTAEELEAARLEAARLRARAGGTVEAALEELRALEARGAWRPRVADRVRRCACRGAAPVEARRQAAGGGAF